MRILSRIRASTADDERTCRLLVILITWMVGAATGVASATPPEADFRRLAFGDGAFGEVWRTTGDATLGQFGRVVAVSDLFLAINGVQGGLTAPRSVRMYRREGGSWMLDGTLEPAGLIGFAGAIALDGLRCAALSATGVRTYVRGADGWVLEAAVDLPGPPSPSSIAMRGDTIALGRPFVDSSLQDIGQVEILTRGPRGWTLTASIANPEPVAGRRFGTAVAFYGDSLLISAPGQTGASAWTGALYRYAIVPPSGTLLETILPVGLTAGANCGETIATDGTRIALGAPEDGTFGASAGAVLILQPSGTGFSQSVVRSHAAGKSRRFGAAVDIVDDELVVGSPQNSGFAERFLLQHDTWSFDRFVLPAPWLTLVQGIAPLNGAQNGAQVRIDPFDGSIIVSAPVTAAFGFPDRGLVSVLEENLPDCNENGRSDLSDAIGSEFISAGPVPFPGDSSISIEIPATPVPTSPVRVTTLGRAIRGSGVVFLNGIPVGRLFQNVSIDCLGTWGPSQVVIPPALYGSITRGGPGILTIRHFRDAGCAPSDQTSLAVEIRYSGDANLTDLDGSLGLDACEDCDGDGVADAVAIGQGLVEDCDENWIPDACESVQDCNGNGVHDACEVLAGSATDCDENGVLDACEINAGTVGDCNADGLPDHCDIVAADGISLESDLFVNLGSPVTGTNALRLQALRTSLATETLYGVSIYWRASWGPTPPPPTALASFIVCSDPNQDGIPDDAVPIRVVTMPLGTILIGTFQQYAIPPTIIGPAGTSFFLGVLLPGSTSIVGLDCDVAPHAGIAYALFNLPADLSGPLAPELMLPLPSNFPRSAWMIQGLGLEAATCLIGRPGDLDDDGLVGPSDLAVLLGSWGMTGVADLDGDGVVGAADLSLLLGLWDA